MGLPFCVLCCPIAKMKTFTTGYLCENNSPSTRVGGWCFAASTLSHKQKWQRGAEPRVNLSLLWKWQKSFFSGTKSGGFNSFKPIFFHVKKPGFVAKGFWV